MTERPIFDVRVHYSCAEVILTEIIEAEYITCLQHTYFQNGGIPSEPQRTYLISLPSQENVIHAFVVLVSPCHTNIAL